MNCRECNTEPAKPHWEKGQLVESGLCFSCRFWEEQIAQDAELLADPAPIWIPCVIEGSHYMFEPGIFTDTRNCGMGGAPYLITVDGREYKTNNLWHQGKIPDRFRDRLPDNATRTPLPRFEKIS